MLPHFTFKIASSKAAFTQEKMGCLDSGTSTCMYHNMNGHNTRGVCWGGEEEMPEVKFLGGLVDTPWRDPERHEDVPSRPS